MKDVLTIVIGIALVCGFSYGCFWVAKKTSYYFFYESFVQDTVREMVKREALKP